MVTATSDMPLGAELTEEDTRAIYARGEEAVVFTILELARRLAEQKAGEASQSHQTPSGMKPPS